MIGKLTSILVVALCAITLAGGFVTYQAWRYRGLAILAQTDADTERMKARAAEAAASAALSALRDEIADLTRRVVVRDAGFPSEDRLASSRAIRDFVYRTNLAGAPTSASTDGKLIYASLGREGYEQLCDGLSRAFAWALDAVGIPARIVQLAAQSFLEGTEQGDTHVTVEAFIEGAWRISDPTFNVEFDCSDGTPNLDVDAARICVAGGHELVPRPGATQIEGRTLDTYYLPFATFLAAYIVPAYEGDGVSTPGQSFPTANWLTEALAKYAPQQ